jgi:uncharacterized protein (TIGR03435 family)
MHCAASALVIFGSLFIYAQSPANASHISDDAAVTFVATSIRPSATSQNGYKLRSSSGRLVASGITAKELIEYAYDLESFQVTGGPAWASRDRYDITAVTDDATAASQAAEGHARKTELTIQLMVRKMLKSRFGLLVHTEAAPGPTYEISVADPMTTTNHPGLESHVADSHPSTGGTNLPGAYNVTMTNVPISSLARRLEDYLHAPVVDKTGLPGIFDITLRWYGDDDVPADGGDDLPGALKRSLNLKIKRIRAPVATLVIDRIAMPSQD